jgi:hypothetical protein
VRATDVPSQVRTRQRDPGGFQALQRGGRAAVWPCAGANHGGHHRHNPMFKYIVAEVGLEIEAMAAHLERIADD